MSFCDKTAHPVAYISITAGEDLPANRFVDYNGSLADNTSKALGVSGIEWNSGDFASLTVLGVMPVEAASAVSLGDDVTATLSGRCKTAVSDEPVNGRALNSAAGLGDFVRVLLVQ